jgi:hypothetical protein
MENRRQSQNMLPPDLRRRLESAHGALLRIHKTLLDYERLRYERQRGPVGGPGEFLQIVIHDPWFAWLHPVSELAVQIDELLSTKEPTTTESGDALLTQARQLIVPLEEGDDFQRAYHRSVQNSPEVALAHAEWKRAAAGFGSTSE